LYVRHDAHRTGPLSRHAHRARCHHHCAECGTPARGRTRPRDASLDARARGEEVLYRLLRPGRHRLGALELPIVTEPLTIHGWGAVTPVGLSSAQSCTAIRARIASFRDVVV